MSKSVILADFQKRDKWDFKEALEKEIRSLGVQDMFRMLGRKRPEEIPDYLAWCDAAFISFADNPLFEMTIPAKLQSYMACGMPILASASGETERIIREAGCGVVCRIGEAKVLAEGILELREMEQGKRKAMGNSAFGYYQKEFNREKLLGQAGRYLDK